MSVAILLNHSGASVELVSIAVTTPPTTTSYSRGASFDATGLVVTATYSNGSTASVTGYTYSPQTLSTIGTQTVTVSYTEDDITCTATTSVSVTASLTGGSVSWNNTQTSQLATYCTWDLTGASTVSVPFSGYMSSARISGDSWYITIRMLFADGTVRDIKQYTTNWNSSETFTIDVSGYTDTQKASVKMQAYGYYSYSVATNRYTTNTTTVGTSTAS